MIAFLKKNLGRLYIAIGWTVFIGILLTLPGSMLPKETGFSIPQFDKIVHMSMFGGFVLLWNLWLSNRGIAQRRLLSLFFVIFVLAAIYGIGSEFVQKYFIPLRDFDEADIIADLIGASLGYGFSNIFLI